MAVSPPSLPYTRRFIRDYLPPARAWYAWGALFLILTVGLQTLLPLWLQRSIAILEKSASGSLSAEHSRGLMTYGLYIIACGTGLAIFRSISRIVIFVPGRRVEAKLRSNYFAALLHNAPTGLSKLKTGDLIARGGGDVTGVRVALSMGVLHIINGVLMLVVCVVCMVRLSPLLTLVCLVPAPLMQAGVRILSTRMMNSFREVADIRGGLSESVREIFGAHMLMTVYDVFEPLFARFETSNVEFQDANERLLKLRALLNTCVASLASIAQVLLLFGGGYLVIQRDAGFGIDAFVAFSAYLGLIQEPLRSGGWLISMFHRGEASLERIYEVTDASADYLAAESGKTAIDTAPAKDGAPLIELRDLHYAYPEDTQGFALSIPKLRLEAGRSYGLFGPVGCGKTSLMSVLTGNIPAPAGTRFLNGQDYTEIRTEDLLRRFSIAPQESHHFSRSIRENIDQVLRNPLWHDAKRAEPVFDEAYRISRLADDIASFPKGLDAVLGEHGINLSGGQKQRLSVLRAWTKPHAILVLDDIVSSLDHHTETELLRELHGTRKDDQTLVIASHRVSALMPCDEILIMDAGRIVDRGTHQELIARHEGYAWTYRHQVLEMAVEA